MQALFAFLGQTRDSLRDLTPVVLVIAAFQLLVIRQPLPPGLDLLNLLLGLVMVVAGLTLAAPDAIIGIAYDSGGVTTSTITVPLLTALGVGLATAIKGRSPILDGFGLIALASVMPIIFVLLFGITGLGSTAE